MKHVFVSYVKADSEKVSRLCDSLNKHGVETWIDRDALQPGQRWKQAIKEAIQQGDFFLACFSSAYWDKQSSYMNEELTLAIEELRKHPANRVWFIPVLLDSSEVPDRPIGAGESLRDLQWVDLSKNWDAGIERIVKVIKPEGEGVSSAFGAAVEALRYKQQKIRDYTGYPSYEFKQAQLKQVESDILALRKSSGAAPRPSTSSTARGSKRTEVGRKPNQNSRERLRAVKLPKGKGEIVVGNDDIVTGRYLGPSGPDLARVELNGEVFMVSNGIGMTFAPNSKVIVAKGPSGLLLAGLADRAD